MRKSILVPVALLMVWWAVSVGRSLSGSRARSGSGESPPAAAPTSVSRKTSHVKTTAPGAVPSKAASAGAGLQGGPVMQNQSPYQRELNTYLELQAKVFLSDEERRERRELLRHAGLIHAMGRRLREATRLPAVMNEQDAAVDFLLEALQDGDSVVAAEALRDVVQDRQIEDAALDKSAREQLAGLKAEVLYQWSAANPSMTATLQGWLPGPVSRKIWANVLSMQQSNLAESAEHLRSGGH